MGDRCATDCGRVTVKSSGRPEEVRTTRTEVACPARQAPALTNVNGPAQRLSGVTLTVFSNKCSDDFVHPGFEFRYSQRPLEVNPRSGILEHSLVRLAALPLGVHSDFAAVEAAVQ